MKVGTFIETLDISTRVSITVKNHQPVKRVKIKDLKLEKSINNLNISKIHFEEYDYTNFVFIETKI